MANSKEFDDIIKALEDKDQEKAFTITKDHVGQLVHAEDVREGSKEGFVEEHKQYKYRLFERAGLTLLHYAAMYDNEKMVEILLKNSADPLKKEKGRARNNAFHYACIFGGEKTIKTFLRTKACKTLVNEVNFFALGPLYYISERKELTLIKLLLEKGADPTQRAEAATVNNTVLHFATKYSTMECVRELLVHIVKKKKDYVNDCEGIHHQTALHIACEEDKVEIAKLLCSNGADVKIRDFEGRTALQVAIQFRAGKCAEFLLENLKLTVKNGLSLLREAIDRPKIVLNILKRHTEEYGRHSINLDKEDNDKKDVLHLIVKSDAYSDEEFKEAAAYLGKNCVEYEDQDGRTPIMIAAMLNNHCRLAILLDIYIRTLTECLFTPDKDYHSKCYEDLMEKTDRQGFSAIHLAVMHDGPDVDFEKTVKVLNSLRKNEGIGQYREKKPLLVQSQCVHPRETSLGVVKDHKKTGMHLAIEMKKGERALTLLKETAGEGVELRDSTGCNVIHCALHHKVQAVMLKQLLDTSTKSDSLRSALKDKNSSGKTVLQTALKLHLSSHAEEILSVNDQTGGDEDRIVDPNQIDSTGKNALRIAIENGAPIELVKKLLDSGCDPLMTDNEAHLAIHVDENTDVEHVKTVLDHPKGLTIRSDTSKKLLDSAIKAKRSDIAKFLLVKGVKVDSLILTEVIIKSENEEFAKLLVRYAEHTQQLMWELRKVGSSAEETESDVLFHALIKKMPDVAEEALNRSVVVKNNNKVDYDNTRILVLNERPRPKKTGGNSYELELKDVTIHEGNPEEVAVRPQSIDGSALDCMVEHEQLKLLQHPGVDHILSAKWKKFGLPLYFVQLFLYCLLVVGPLSVLVLLPMIVAEDTQDFEIAAYTLSGIIIVASLFHLVLLLVILFRGRNLKCKALKRALFPVINKFHHYLQAMVFVLAITFSTLTIINTATSGCCTSGTWHLGLLIIVLGWTHLIHLSSKLPFIGEQAIVFLDIVQTFLRLTLFALLLVLAATIILLMTFFNAEAMHSPFITFRRGLVTVITMITGELDYSSVFGLSYEVTNDTAIDDDVSVPSLLYPNTTNFVWVLFLIFIPILLSNMLTGLAVGDVIEIQKNAELRKLGHQVKLVESAEYYFGSRHDKKSGNTFMTMFHDIWLEYVYDDDSKKKHREMKEKLLSYEKKREAEITEIKESGDSRKDNRISDSIDDVKKVALSCEKRITEFKDTYDSTVKKLVEEQEAQESAIKKMMENSEKILKALERTSSTD